jgi:hypothetical protein
MTKAGIQSEINEVFVSARNTYDRVMAVERNMTDEARAQLGQQWKNIMFSMLSLIVSLNADDAFDKRKAEEYDSMIDKYGSVFHLDNYKKTGKWRQDSNPSSGATIKY